MSIIIIMMMVMVMIIMTTTTTTTTIIIIITTTTITIIISLKGAVPDMYNLQYPHRWPNSKASTSTVGGGEGVTGSNPRFLPSRRKEGRGGGRGGGVLGFVLLVT